MRWLHRFERVLQVRELLLKCGVHRVVLGGEEFLLVLPGCSAEEIPAVFARLRNAVVAIEIAGLPANQPVRFCMGAVSVTAGSGLDVLLGQADLALYASKTAGRDQWAVV